MHQACRIHPVEAEHGRLHTTRSVSVWWAGTYGGMGRQGTPSTRHADASMRLGHAGSLHLAGTGPGPGRCALCPCNIVITWQKVLRMP